MGSRTVDPRDALSALKIDRETKRERPDRGRPWLAVAIAALAACAIGAAFWWTFRSHPPAVHTITIETASTPGSTLNASGYVVAQQQATVAAQITGMVTAVYVTEGARVTAGQILAQLDDSAARAVVKQAQSQLEADRALPSEYRAQLVRDRRTLERTQALINAKAIAETNLDAAVAAAGVDEAELAHAIGQVAVDEKALASAETQLSFTVIRAPFAGVVTERYAHPGEMISPEAVGGFTQTGICKVVDMKSLEIDVDVNEAYVERVHAGQKVEAILDAYPDWTIPAHVLGVVPTANEQKATVKVRIAFDRLDPRILPQMGVQARFLAAGAIAASPVIRLPATALRHDGKDFVLLVENGRAARRDVTVRPGPGGMMLVLGGLSGGERVIASGDEPITNGEEIREP